ncbi:hypothetical protein ASG22_05130 [Chryseobacterium sp. Leaf405]|uniref:hypothetical protein n=1 Tax=Chryseobacterium sp. Leaf405 TaxID=1736367 RepID=UPI000701CFCD|nr:hypothetical protein [Chryseobacterium sp. Leaf405]KQT26062.1 hypothetical protein ASG22_05130 [Chryseobacterium sp. Leaf405]
MKIVYFTALFASSLLGVNTERITQSYTRCHGDAGGYYQNRWTNYETVIGINNAIAVSTPNLFIPTDPIFQVGNGFSNPAWFNAMTILKNGKTGVGIVGTKAAAKPTELLDIVGAATAGNGGVKIRNINSTAYTGNKSY